MRKIKTAIFFVVALSFLFILFNTSRGEDAGQDFKREPLPTEADISLAIGELQSMFEQLEEAEDDLDKKTFDPQAVVDEIGNDPEALFRWVCKQTYLVPYTGTLRGPRGVLMDRLGSSLDRALLLYELLDRSGHEVRLARATLSREQAEELLDKLERILSSVSYQDIRSQPQASDDFAEEFAAKYQLDSSELKETLKNEREEQARIAGEMRKRAKKQAAAIAEAVKKSGIEGISDDESFEIEALQDHWWVQWQSEEAWINMDPSLPDSRVGQALAEAEAWFDPDDLDEEHLHQVHIRLVIEQWNDGKLYEKSVLEHTLQPYDFFGEQIVVRHYPLDWPLDKDLFEEKDPLQSLKNTLLNQKAWAPTLSIGSEETVGILFDETGELIKKKKKARGISAFQRSFLRASSGKEKEEKAKGDSYLTAEWIEYQICSPGKPAFTARREIFDLLGPVQRTKETIPPPAIGEARRMTRCLGILSQIEILILTSSLYGEFIEYLSIENLLHNRDLLLDLLQQLNELEPQEALARMAEITPQPGKVYDFALARSKFVLEDGLVFLDQPNILSCYSGVEQNPQGDLRRYSRLDIVENDVAVVGHNPFQIRMKQGVLDTNIEAFLVGPDENAQNTSAIFARDKDWLTLKSQEEEAYISLELDPDSLERIRQDLKQGYIILAPKRAFKIDGREWVTWWRINPRTGQTVGVGGHGWGQAIVEYVETAQTMIQLKLQIEAYMGIMECVVNTAALALAGADMKTVYKYAVKKCIWNKICGYMMKQLTGYFLAGTIWSNFIVKKTAGWISGKLCKSALK